MRRRLDPRKVLARSTTTCERLVGLAMLLAMRSGGEDIYLKEQETVRLLSLE
jgi:hypothetical protein